MALQHDQAGFLIGEKVLQANEDILTSQEQNFRVLTRIRSDVSAIAKALGAQSKNQARNTRTGYGGQRAAPVAVAAVPAGRGGAGARTAGGNQTSGPQRVAAQSSGRRASMSVAVPVGRDSRGRFVAGQKPDGSPPASPREAASGGGAMKRLSDSIGRLSASLPAADGIDPTVNAFREIKDVVSPLGRGLFSMFGRGAERKKERWYQRFWKALTSPAAGKRTEVVGGAGSGGRGGLFGALGGLGAMLAGAPAMLMGLLTRIFMPIAAIWGSWELGKWIGSKIYEWLDKSGVMAKVLDAFDSIGASFSSAWESVKSGYETVVSGIEGAWKTITDGFKSALDAFMAFPEKIGQFFSGLDDAMRNLPVVGKAYAAASDAAKAAASDAKKGYEEGKSGKTDAPPATAVQAIARDVGKGVGAVKEVGAQAGAGYDAARGRATDAPAPTNIVQRAARSVGGMAGKAADRWNGGAKADIVGAAGTAGVDAGLLAQIAHFESGFNKDAAPITRDGKRLSSAHGYGQFLDGTWVDMVNKHGAKYGVANAGKLSKADALALRSDTKLQAGMLAEYTKENAAKGRALGGTDDAASVYALHNLGGGDGAKLLKALKSNPDAPVSSILSGKVVSNNKSLYGDGSISVSEAYSRMGAKMRSGDSYAADARLAQGVLRPPSAVTASLPPPASANIPPAVPAQIPEQAKADIPERLNSSAGSGNKVSVSIKDKLTQDVGDRGIAHIMTGGMGSA